MQDWSKYGFIDREVVKYDLLLFFYKMKMINTFEVFRLFDLINEMEWEKEERDG